MCKPYITIMKLKSLFFYFSCESRIARLHIKYDGLKCEAIIVQQKIDRMLNPRSLDECLAFMTFVMFDEKDLKAKLKSLCERRDRCRHRFLWLEYKQRGGFLLT